MGIEKIDLSIIIPVYNASTTLKRCLDSIFHQTTHYSFEVILVDDGSTDDSVEIIKARKENNMILCQQKNAGPAVARNKGLELSNGKYCAYIDADDYWEDGYIEQTVSFLENHNECVAVTVGQRIKNTQGDKLFPQDWISQGKDFVINDFFTAWANNQFVGTCSTTMITSSVRKIGGQRLDLRCMEDWNFWFRLATCGKWGFLSSILYVSDGLIATPTGKSWINKMKVRWENTPFVDDWQKDIIDKFQGHIPHGYAKARGFIIRVMAYGHIMSGRVIEARKEVIEYSKNFPCDTVSKLMSKCKCNLLLWKLFCIFLKWRELYRYK